MKNLEVIKTLILYDKDNKVLKEIDVSTLPWKMAYIKASISHQMSIYSARWKIIVEPKE